MPKNRYRHKYIIKPDTNCWEWQGKSLNHGYPQLWHWDEKKIVIGSRYFYEIYKGKIPRGLVIDHLCKNTLCLNPDHLEAVTIKENIRRGNGTKLAYSEIDEIKDYYWAGFPESEIAEIYKINQSHVNRIVHGKRVVSA